MPHNLAITPLTSTIGARIADVSLRALSDEAAEEIRQQLDENAVLVFPDQHLDPAQQCAFAKIFGPLEPLQSLKFIGHDHVVILEDLLAARDRRPHTQQWVEFDGWHVDSSFTECVPRAAVLRAEVIPPSGGMTSWANVCAAYEALSPAMRAWLGSLKAVHAYPAGYREAIGIERLPQDVQDRFDTEFAPRAHPLVFRHPRSGRQGLFVNPSYTTHIEGLSAKESRLILSFLFTHMTSPEFVYRHLWKEGDIVVWDELATLHLAPDPSDFAPHPRRVVRVTAGLEQPTATADT